MSALHDRIKHVLADAYTHGRATEQTVNAIQLMLFDALTEEFQKVALKVNWPGSLVERQAAVKGMMTSLFGDAKPQPAGSDST